MKNAARSLAIALLLALAASPALAGSFGDVSRTLRATGIEPAGALPPAAPGSAGRAAGPSAGEAWVPIRVDLSPGFRASNKTTAKLVGPDGRITGESIGNSTADHLVDLLQRAVASGRRITNLEIKGHGAPELQQMGADTFLVVAGRSVIAKLRDGREVDIAPLLGRALAADAVVNLNSCKSGRGEDSVAQNLSRALPGRLVSGGSFYQMSIPFTSKAFGTKNYFRDGAFVTKRWYNID